MLPYVWGPSYTFDTGTGIIVTLARVEDVSAPAPWNRPRADCNGPGAVPPLSSEEPRALQLRPPSPAPPNPPAPPGESTAGGEHVRQQLFVRHTVWPQGFLSLIRAQYSFASGLNRNRLARSQSFQLFKNDDTCLSSILT